MTITDNSAKSNETTAVLAYVGCYTTPALNGKGKGGIEVFQVDSATATWTHLQTLTGVDDVSFIAVNRQNHFLYAVLEGADSVSSLSIDQQSGQLALLNTESTGGSTPASLALDPSDHFALVGNYFGGSVAVLPIAADGKLQPIATFTTLEGTPGPDKVEQTSSHPHDVVFDLADRYVIVPDKGFDRLFIYQLDANSGQLVPQEPVVAKPGSGPRHITFHHSLPYAYVIHELDSTITVYHYEAEAGKLVAGQTISALPADFTGSNTAAEIELSQDGKFLYASNRGNDTIAVFSVDQANGELTSIQWVSAGGQTPRFFILDPNGKFLYVANQNGHNIVTFAVDQTTGKLTATGQVVEIGSPVCIELVTQKQH